MILPTVEERLDSIARALEAVIIPSLPEQAKLAIELTQLSIGHLKIVSGQLDKLGPLMATDQAAIFELGSGLAAQADGGAATMSAATALKAVLGGSDRYVPSRDVIASLSAAVCHLIDAASEDGRAEFTSYAVRTGLAFEQAQSGRERELFYGYGFDSTDNM